MGNKFQESATSLVAWWFDSNTKANAMASLQTFSRNVHNTYAWYLRGTTCSYMYRCVGVCDIYVGSRTQYRNKHRQIVVSVYPSTWKCFYILVVFFYFIPRHLWNGFLRNRIGFFNTDVLIRIDNSRPAKISILELLNAKPINENYVTNTTRNPSENHSKVTSTICFPFFDYFPRPIPDCVELETKWQKRKGLAGYLYT